MVACRISAPSVRGVGPSKREAAFVSSVHDDTLLYQHSSRQRGRAELTDGWALCNNHERTP